MTGPVNPKSGFSYDLPTKNTDGSALSSPQIAKFQIGLGPQSGNYTLIKDDVTLESGNQVSPMSLLGQLAYGQWHAAVRTASKDGKLSDWSAEAAFELEPPTLEPPANFSIA